MRSDNTNFRVTSPVPRDVWESLIKSSQDFVVSQSLPWHDAIFESGMYKDASLLYEFSSGQQLILPMARRRKRTPLEPMAASWPRRWGAGGPISGDGRIDRVQAAAVLRHAARRDIFGADIHLSHVCDPIWLHEAQQFRVIKEPCYVLDLVDGFDEIWRHKFQGTVRTAVRKAERSALDVEIDRSGKLLKVFYDLYEKSIERWSETMSEPSWFAKWHVTRATPLSMLTAVAKHLGGNCTTWMAWSKGDPVAAIIVLRAGSHAQFWRGAMDKSLAGPLRANQLLHRLAIEEACRDGCRSYDMGIAEPGSSLATFKEKLGATLYFSHYAQAQRLPIQGTIDLSKKLARKAISLRNR